MATATKKKPRTPAQRAATKRMLAGKKKSLARPSQITKKPPTKRLKERRAMPAKRGYFPNPDATAHKLRTLIQANFALLKQDVTTGIERMKLQAETSYLQGLIRAAAILGVMSMDDSSDMLYDLRLLTTKDNRHGESLRDRGQ